MTTRDDPKMVQTPYGMRQGPGAPSLSEVHDGPAAMERIQATSQAAADAILSEVASKAAQPIPDLSVRRTFNPLDAGFSLVADPDETAKAAHPAEGVYSLGPWMASGVRQRLLDERQQYLVVVRAHGGGVAYTPYSDLTAAEHRESHADQRLIAAAPTMAAEIERLHAIIHGMQDGALIRDQAAQIERLRGELTNYMLGFATQTEERERLEAETERLRAEKAEMLAALKAINVSGPDADGLLWIEFRPLNTRAVGAVSVRAEQLVGQALALWSEDRNAAITRAEGRQP